MRMPWAREAEEQRGRAAGRSARRRRRRMLRWLMQTRSTTRDSPTTRRGTSPTPVDVLDRRCVSGVGGGWALAAPLGAPAGSRDLISKARREDRLRGKGVRWRLQVGRREGGNAEEGGGSWGERVAANSLAEMIIFPWEVAAGVGEEEEEEAGEEETGEGAVCGWWRDSRRPRKRIRGVEGEEEEEEVGRGAQAED